VIVGAIVSLLAASACNPLGTVAGPWTLLRPRRIRPLLTLLAVVSARVVAANWELTRAIWSRQPPPGGMVVVPTRARTDAELAAVGVFTSLIVNSQLIDLDRRDRPAHLLPHRDREDPHRRGRRSRARRRHSR
jgi:multicomponent Na+:H+ antiporter subunit E